MRGLVFVTGALCGLHSALGDFECGKEVNYDDENGFDTPSIKVLPGNDGCPYTIKTDAGILLYEAYESTACANPVDTSGGPTLTNAAAGAMQNMIICNEAGTHGLEIEITESGLPSEQPLGTIQAYTSGAYTAVSGVAKEISTSGACVKLEWQDGNNVKTYWIGYSCTFVGVKLSEGADSEDECNNGQYDGGIQDMYGAAYVGNQLEEDSFYFYAKCADGLAGLGGNGAVAEETAAAAEDGAAVEVSGSKSDADDEFTGASIGITAGVVVAVVGTFAGVLYAKYRNTQAKF